ncbi:MAG TPA: M48 family metalloprotease, partial [Parvularculaceae bacterium]|nr:M48 family metalloprotease [Parvularculaceae bacterium]
MAFYRNILAIFAVCFVWLGHAQAQTLLRDAEIEQWLDDYARPIYKAAGLPAGQIKILLIGDPTLNAFASGLTMGINTGLITAADTPNQIEGVIAHETGHMAGGHTARSDEAMASAARPMILSLVLAAGAAAAGAPEAGLGILG